MSHDILQYKQYTTVARNMKWKLDGILTEFIKY